MTNRLPLSGVTLLLAAASLVPAAPAQTVWVNTATQGISLSQLASATDLGRAPADQAITVRLALNMRNKAALINYVKNVNDPNSALYGQSLTPAQFAATYGATSAQVSAAVNYLQKSGFTNLVVEPNNLLISADGTVAKANAAFNTHIEQFNQFGEVVYGNTTVAQVPVALNGIVGAVLGLNSIGKMKPTLVTRTQVATPTYAVSYNPQDFWKVYGVGSTPTGVNTNVAVIAEGNVTQVVKDLRVAEAHFNLPQVPVSIVQTGIASPDTAGLDEWDMDTQYLTGMAGTVKRLYIYTGTSLTNSDLALEISRWATQNLTRVANASLGECEFFPFIDGSMLADDNSFLQGAAQGMTFFASSGDTGSFCPVGAAANGVPAGAPFVSYPASSPYVVGVGGTTLLADSGNVYDQETTWYAGGGGISQFEYSPYWQVNAGVLSGSANSKGVPDIAMDADPYSGANVYVNGQWNIYGGTSLSSPLAAGVWARVVSGKPKFGMAGPHLYSVYNGTVTPGAYPHGGYHDIIAGANGLYSAGPGYDFTTGLGTFSVNQFYTYVK